MQVLTYSDKKSWFGRYLQYRSLQRFVWENREVSDLDSIELEICSPNSDREKSRTLQNADNAQTTCPWKVASIYLLCIPCTGEGVLEERSCARGEGEEVY